MTTIPQRIGNFTSSEIYKLLATGKQQLGFGVGAMTYIRLTNYERIMGRSVDTESNPRQFSFGKLMEEIVFETKLGTDYTLTSEWTDMHPTIDYWAGSKDGARVDGDKILAIVEQKNPLSMNGFMDYYIPIYAGKTGLDVMIAYRDGFTFKKDGVDFDVPPLKAGIQLYWQCVSNGIINSCDEFEFIFHMPEQKELAEIIQHPLVNGNPTYNWMKYALDEELPYLPENCGIPSLNKVCFTLPAEDKELLTEKVLLAGKLLIPRIEK